MQCTRRCRPHHIRCCLCGAASLHTTQPATPPDTPALLQTIKTPVSAKIRIFPDLNDTLRYARLLESAGASLVAVHGRTRDQKDAKAIRADWDAIRAVKAALSIPVLGNGDIRCLADARRLLQATGADGVMSASPLLDDPGLFWPPREGPSPHTDLARFDLALEYLDIAESHPVPMRMVRVRHRRHPCATPG